MAGKSREKEGLCRYMLHESLQNMTIKLDASCTQTTLSDINEPSEHEESLVACDTLSSGTMSKRAMAPVTKALPTMALSFPRGENKSANNYHFQVHWREAFKLFYHFRVHGQKRLNSSTLWHPVAFTSGSSLPLGLQSHTESSQLIASTRILHKEGVSLFSAPGTPSSPKKPPLVAPIIHFRKILFPSPGRLEGLRCRTACASAA